MPRFDTIDLMMTLEVWIIIGLAFLAGAAIGGWGVVQWSYRVQLRNQKCAEGYLNKLAEISAAGQQRQTSEILTAIAAEDGHPQN